MPRSRRYFRLTKGEQGYLGLRELAGSGER